MPMAATLTIDELFQQQAAELDQKSGAEQSSTKIQQLLHEKADLCADLAARFHQRIRPARR